MSDSTTKGSKMIPPTILAIGGIPVIVSTSDLDFLTPEDAADCHREKVRSLIAYGRKNGTAEGWSFRTVRHDGRIIVWRYQGLGMIDKTFRIPFTDADTAYDNRNRANETAQDNADISEFTTPESLGRSLTKSELNRRDHLRRTYAKARGFKSWKLYLESLQTDAPIPSEIHAEEGTDDPEVTPLAADDWDDLTHPMDRPAVQTVRRAVQPNRMASARYVSGHRMD